MPIVPVQTQGISSDVPTPSFNPNAFGQVAEAVGGVGAQTGALGQTMLQQMHAIEAQDAAESAFNQHRIDSEKKITQLKLTSPDGYIHGDDGVIQQNPDGTPRSITQEYRDWADGEYKHAYSNMPSLAAQQLYKQKTEPFFSSQIDAVYNDEQVSKISAARTGKVFRDQSIADSLVTAPALRKLYDSSNQSRSDWQDGVGKLYAQPVANEQMLKNDQQFAESTIRGAIDQIYAISNDPKAPAFSAQKQAQQWVDLLNEDPNDPRSLSAASFVRNAHGLPILAQMLDPDKKAHLLHQLLSATQQTQTMDMSRLNLALKEAEAAARIGQFNRYNSGQLKQEVMNAAANKAIIPELAAQKIGDLSFNERMASLPKNVNVLPWDQQKEIGYIAAQEGHRSAQQALSQLPGVFEPANQIGSISEEEGRKKVDELVKQRKAAAESDWAAYLGDATSNGGQHPYTLRMNAQFESRGVSWSNPSTFTGNGKILNDQISMSHALYDTLYPNDPTHFRVMSKEQSDQMALYFKDQMTGKSVQEKAASLRAFKDSVGDSTYASVMDQMIRDEKLPAKWRFASIFGNSQAQTQDVIDALLTDTKSKDWEVKLARNGLSANTMNVTLGTVFGKFLDAAEQASPGDPLASMSRSEILQVAEAKAVNNMGIRASDFPAAAQQAYDSLVGKNFWVGKAEAPGSFFGLIGNRPYSLVIPKVIGNQQISSTDADTITAYSKNIMTPDGLKALGAAPPKKLGGAFTDHPEEFYKQVATNDGRVSIDTKAGGLRIWWYDKYHNQDVTVNDAKGKPLLIPLSTALSFKAGK